MDSCTMHAWLPALVIMKKEKTIHLALLIVCYGIGQTEMEVIDWKAFNVRMFCVNIYRNVNEI